MDLSSLQGNVINYFALCSCVVVFCFFSVDFYILINFFLEKILRLLLLSTETTETTKKEPVILAISVVNTSLY